MEETIAANAAALDGKLVIDAANRMGATTPNSRVACQQHAPGARYVRAFNSLGWENFANPTFDGVQADLFYAGPEADRALVEQLIADVGLRPMRLGDSDQAGLVDSVSGLWFALAIGQQHGRHLAFKVLTS
jgi:predicted dinucleotide-binding enzyme